MISLRNFPQKVYTTESFKAAKKGPAGKNPRGPSLCETESEPLDHGKFRQMAVSQARELVESGAYIVDAREEGKFQTGHLLNAHNIPLSQLRRRSSPWCFSTQASGRLRSRRHWSNPMQGKACSPRLPGAMEAAVPVMSRARWLYAKISPRSLTPITPSVKISIRMWNWLSRRMERANTWSKL